jgi:hypothetical protein
MKIRDVLENFSIHASNEENALLASLNGPRAIEDFSEREQFILENLIRKSLVIKIKNGRSYSVAVNQKT